jgi:metallo-beta-lactamase class B
MTAHPVLLALALALPATLSAQATKPLPIGVRDTAHYAPFRIIDNVYYVGSLGLASYLVTTPQGHVLIDTGLRETGQQVLENIAALGFKPRDVKIMLSTHAHFDHVAGHALVKAATGAQVYATAEDAKLLESGGATDFRFGGEYAFDPVKVDRRIKHGDTVTLGGARLTAHVTPGHTKGNTMWTLKVKDGGRTYDLAVAPSMSINPGVKMLSYAPYPDIARDYAASLDYLETLHPDVFLGPHASFFDMEAKAKRLREGATTNPFIDPDGYRAFIAGYRRAYEAQVRAERALPVP